MRAQQQSSLSVTGPHAGPAGAPSVSSNTDALESLARAECDFRMRVIPWLVALNVRKFIDFGTEPDEFSSLHRILPGYGLRTVYVATDPEVVDRGKRFLALEGVACTRC
jgi:hypothetical protein